MPKAPQRQTATVHVRRRRSETQGEAEIRWLRENPPTRSAPKLFALSTGDVCEFTSGRLIAVHTIGEYTIVEYEPDRAGNVLPKDHDASPHFMPWIGSKRMAWSFGSLDAALAGIIGYKHEGLNSRAASYFMRMIGATNA